MQHTLLTDGQPWTVAFNVLSQQCGPKANEREKGVTLLTKNGEGRTFPIDLLNADLHDQ